MPTLTVFTPAYNRAELLTRCYRSLQEQTVKDFVWIIVDDGSADNTGELALRWVKGETAFPVEYYRKENGGLHTAYNLAIEKLRTELAVCIDSDDFMPPDAVEKILRFWNEHGSEQYAGIIGLDRTLNGEILGGSLPEMKAVNLIDLATGKCHLPQGDRKLVIRSELYQSVAPMRVFEGEKNFNPNYMHLEISRRYDFLVMNEVLCEVDYQPTGMSAGIYRQYQNSPQSFAELRKQHLSFRGISFGYRCKEYIHYISSCIFAKKDCGLQNRSWLLYILLCPVGAALNLLIRYKNRKNN